MKSSSSKTVAITQKIPVSAIRLLKEAGLKVKANKTGQAFTGNDLIKFCEKADGVVSFLSDRFNADVIRQLPKCRILANCAAGYNNIDVSAARKNGIIVTNTPDVLTDATADLTMGLMLAAARHIAAGDRFTRAGLFKGWEIDMYLGIQFSSSIVGIIGAGRIGRAVAKRAAAFGAKIIYYSNSRNKEIEKETKAVYVTLDELLRQSDIVTIHTPLNEKSLNMLNRKKLNLLKRGAVLVNTARGGVLDEKYLIEMLKKRRIMAAALDVYENEPNLNTDLFKLDNVVLAPHIGSATTVGRNQMAELAAKNIINVLAGKSALTPV